MWRARRTALMSEADMLEDGGAEPAAVLQRMASTRSCWASSWMAEKSSRFTSVVTFSSYRVFAASCSRARREAAKSAGGGRDQMKGRTEWAPVGTPILLTPLAMALKT